MDVDILACYDQNGSIFHYSSDSQNLILPHPRIFERPFVLAPLADIASKAEIGLSGETVEHLLEKFPLDEMPPRVLQLGRLTHRFERDRCLIMGVLNITPDSFSDGGKFQTVDEALKQAEVLVNDGADLLDVGGQSTRPGAAVVGIDTELGRVLPVVEALSKNFDAPISIDTFHARVAEAAVSAGASWVNDVSGGTRDNKIAGTCVELGVPLCVMHMRGTSETMQSLTDYPDGIDQLRKELSDRVQTVENAGLPRWDVVVDPGIGFSKTQEFCLEMLAEWPSTVPIKYPVLCGPSRKSFIQKALAAHGLSKMPPKSDMATAAVLSQVISSGRCHIARVHCVESTHVGIALGDALRFRKYRTKKQ